MPEPLPTLAGGVGPPGTRWAYRCGPTREPAYLDELAAG